MKSLWITLCGFLLVGFVISINDPNMEHCRSVLDSSQLKFEVQQELENMVLHEIVSRCQTDNAPFILAIIKILDMIENCIAVKDALEHFDELIIEEIWKIENGGVTPLIPPPPTSELPGVTPIDVTVSTETVPMSLCISPSPPCKMCKKCDEKSCWEESCNECQPCKKCDELLCWELNCQPCVETIHSSTTTTLSPEIAPVVIPLCISPSPPCKMCKKCNEKLCWEERCDECQPCKKCNESSCWEVNCQPCVETIHLSTTTTLSPETAPVVIPLCISPSPPCKMCTKCDENSCWEESCDKCQPCKKCDQFSCRELSCQPCVLIISVTTPSTIPSNTTSASMPLCISPSPPCKMCTKCNEKSCWEERCDECQPCKKCNESSCWEVNCQPCVETIHLSTTTTLSPEIAPVVIPLCISPSPPCKMCTKCNEKSCWEERCDECQPCKKCNEFSCWELNCQPCDENINLATTTLSPVLMPLCKSPSPPCKMCTKCNKKSCWEERCDECQPCKKCNEFSCWELNCQPCDETIHLPTTTTLSPVLMPLCIYPPPPCKMCTKCTEKYCWEESCNECKPCKKCDEFSCSEINCQPCDEPVQETTTISPNSPVPRCIFPYPQCRMCRKCNGIICWVESCEPCRRCQTCNQFTCWLIECQPCNTGVLSQYENENRPPRYIAEKPRPTLGQSIICMIGICI